MLPNGLSQFVIGPAPAWQWVAALQMALGPGGGDARAAEIASLLLAAREGKLSFAGLITATLGRELWAAGWATLAAGRAGVVFPVQLAPQASENLASEIHRHMEAYLVDEGARFCQALLPFDSGDSGQRLLRAGMIHACNLAYMAATVDSFPQTNPAPGLRFTPYSPAGHAAFAALVDRTYEGTRDCAALNGVRSIDEVLAGYREVGTYAPERWLTVARINVPVGCLILAEHPREGNWELVYLGVLPEFRGQRLGIEITRYGQWLAKAAGAPRMVLAVDLENTPALAAYAVCGFQIFERRSVYLKPLHAAKAGNRVPGVS